MKNGVFKPEQKHIDYINSVRAELMEAEATVSRIKNSNEWKRAYNYFSLQKTRGTIKEKPTKENGYRIELYESAEVVRLDDLSGIVTPEQMEKIKNMLSVK